MTAHPPTLSELLAALHQSAKADCAAARARRDAVHALFFALLARLFGRLEALAHLRAPAASRPLPPRAPVPHSTPGPRAARHRGPVPPRAYRRGRIPTWWSRHRGARAIPRHAPELRPPHPARAPPIPPATPISRQKTPQPGCDHARP